MTSPLFPLPDRPALALAAIAAASYAVFILRTAFDYGGAVGFTLFDDAMVSMRYARNLAEGFGLVWNPGDTPVEGYTNPLWTLWMAAVHRAGADDLRASLVVASGGGVILVLTAVAARQLAEAVWKSRAVSLAAFGLVLFSYPLVFWTLRGMEVGLVALCTTVAALAVVRSPGRVRASDTALLAVSITAAVLTRRDAAVMVVPLAAYGWFTSLESRRPLTVVVLGSAALGLAVQTAFSVWYYGDPLPNTYYLKLAGVGLDERLARGVSTAAVQVARTMAVPLALAMFVFRVSGGPRREPIALLAALVAGQVAYSIWVGGDAWEYMGYANRYVSSALPILAVLTAAGLVEVVRRGRRVVLGAAALLLASVSLRAVVEVVLHAANRLVTRGSSYFIVDPALYTAAAGAGALAAAAAAGIAWRKRLVRDARPLPYRKTLVAAGFAVWAVSNGAATAEWMLHNASAVANDSRFALAGLAIRDLTSEGTVIAVTSAGSLPYFARRPAVDILGKSDHVVARLPPRLPLWPGHNKWDLDRSIKEFEPDLVFGLPRAPGQVEYLLRHGYEPWHGTFFARRASGELAKSGLKSELARVFPDSPPDREAR